MEPDTDNLSIDLSKAGKLACESCGAEFTCSAGQEHCWCSEVKVSPENLTVLREKYKQCLCKDCLEKKTSPPDTF
jgi:hypothetical protein